MAGNGITGGSQWRRNPAGCSLDLSAVAGSHVRNDGEDRPMMELRKIEPTIKQPHEQFTGDVYDAAHHA